MNLIFDRESSGWRHYYPQDGDLVRTTNGNWYRLSEILTRVGVIDPDRHRVIVRLVRQRLRGGDYGRGGVLDVDLRWIEHRVADGVTLAENICRALVPHGGPQEEEPAQPVAPFAADEVRLMQGAIRLELRHEDRKLAALVRRFGEDADLSGGRARIELLESAYRKLGGDPARITNRAG